MKVKKRDGSIDSFDSRKIYEAVMKAFKEVDGKVSEESEKMAQDIAISVTKKLADVEITSVSDIQKIVEYDLMDSPRKDVARAYIGYRANHDMVRDRYDDLMNKVAEKLEGKNVANQNANVDESSFGGRNGEANRVVTKTFALEKIMSKKARTLHDRNRVYTHDLDSYAVGEHNCYNSNTEFVTDEGVKKFGECNDGQKVKVVDLYGIWRDATVRKYGKQKMYDLTFKSSLTTKTVTCTRNHRWVLQDGTVTDNINIGDSLYITPEIIESNTPDDKLWCFGFVIGDGTDGKRHSKDGTTVTNMFMKVRLCGSKVGYLNRFLNCGWHIGSTLENGDIELFTRAGFSFKQNFLNDKMWKLMSHNDLYNVFSGYLAADGHVTKNGANAVSTSDVRVKEFIEYASVCAGYYVWSKRLKRNDTNYKKDRELYEFRLVKKQSTKWTLVDIKASRSGENGYQVAWCVEEPVTHTFTLQGAMVTGNCLSVPFDKLLKNGFNTRQTDVRPAQSINSAMQLVAVIFQLQSLQQFGGVSAAHLDWTLAPYVRKSFMKHYIVSYLKDNDEFVDIDLMNLIFDYYTDDVGIERNRLEDWIDEHKSEFFERTGLKEEDFCFANKKNLDKKHYQSAMYDTIIETKQAAEALLHNLNTLQSRSGDFELVAPRSNLW